MNLVKNAGYTLLWSFFAISQTFAALDFGTDKATPLAGAQNADPTQAIMNLILSFLTFVTLVAVVYILWSGFQVLTGGSDDKALDKAKKTIINVIIGIIVMWLAYAIVSWVIGALR